MSFTDEDAAYVERRLGYLGDVNVDECDFRCALRATLPLPSERFVAYWGLDRHLDINGAKYADFEALFANRSGCLDFIAGTLAARLQVCRLAAEE